MDRRLREALAELKLEYGGIRMTIIKYSKDGNIINYLDELQKALQNNDLYSIKYCMNAISKWYKDKIGDILSNGFVGNKTSHSNNQEKINELLKIFNEYEADVPDTDEIEDGIEGILHTDEPLVFLSHKSDDKKYADALEKFIIGLGVNNNQLIYTSHPLHKIPMDANIYDYLRKNINGNVFIIFLFSNEYLQSPACMNEMGAAWVVQSDYTNIYTPDFSFGNPLYHQCAIDTNKMGAVLNGDAHCKASMLELKDKIQNLFNLENDEKTTQYLLDEFIKDILE